MNNTSIYQTIGKVKFLHPYNADRIVGLSLVLLGIVCYASNLHSILKSHEYYTALTLLGPPLLLFGLGSLLFPENNNKLGEYVENPDLEKEKKEGRKFHHKIIRVITTGSGLLIAISDALYLNNKMDFSLIAFVLKTAKIYIKVKG